jgi:hypothetical protein
MPEYYSAFNRRSIARRVIRQAIQGRTWIPQVIGFPCREVAERANNLEWRVPSWRNLLLYVGCRNNRTLQMTKTCTSRGRRL